MLTPASIPALQLLRAACYPVSSSTEAVLLSLADKLHNARALEEGLYAHGEAMWERFFKARKYETLWFYRELMKIYRAKGFAANWLFVELDRLLERIFKEWYS